MSTLSPGVRPFEEAQSIVVDISHAIGRIALRYRRGTPEAHAEIQRSIVLILTSVAELESLALDLEETEGEPTPGPRPTAPSDGTIAFVEAAAKIKARRAAERREST